MLVLGTGMTVESSLSKLTTTDIVIVQQSWRIGTCFIWETHISSLSFTSSEELSIWWTRMDFHEKQLHTDMFGTCIHMGMSEFWITGQDVHGFRNLTTWVWTSTIVYVVMFGKAWAPKWMVEDFTFPVQLPMNSESKQLMTSPILRSIYIYIYIYSDIHIYIYTYKHTYKYT